MKADVFITLNILSIKIMTLYMINQGELQEVDKPVFSTGDCYVLDDGSIVYNWLGSKCSIDEKTASAAYAHKLDESRGGAAKIITVDEGEEPANFLAAVSKIGTMRIVKQNYAKTMLKDVDTNEFSGYNEWVNMLYRISSEEFEGMAQMKMIQVPFKKESLDSEDSFIADLGIDIFVWHGATCNFKEKFKSGQWARELDAERAGGQKPKIFDEGDDAEFIEALEKGKTFKDNDRFLQIHPESKID